jgi:cyclase
MSLFLALGAIAVVMVLVVERLPRARSQAGDLKLRKVADEIYLYRGFFSNSVVFVLGDGVLIVDTQVAPLAARRLRTDIEKITSKPIRWVVNTHYHGDHTGGNALFPEADIIATSQTARFVVERDRERVEYAETFGLAFQEVHPTIGPTRTFDGSLILELGGERIELHQIGRCETPDACVVYWPRRGAVACGDGVATDEYPFNGVPFMDEGLRDDGEWVRFLQTIKSWNAHYLLPGHGEPLVGSDAINARMELLSSLFEDVLRATRVEMARGTPFAELVERVDTKLSRYREHPGLHEGTVSQRFLIYRAFNNLSPDRKGKGWWHDLRPSVIVREACTEPFSLDRARSLDRPRAITMLETHLQKNETDAAAWALLSDVFLDGAQKVRPKVDATEYFVASTKAAKRALAIDPDAQLALLNLGCAEVFGGMVLAQSMQPAIEKLERALAKGGLTAKQALKARFFLGKAHQMELRDRESDKHLRQLLPLPLRPLYPLVRSTLRSMP